MAPNVLIRQMQLQDVPLVGNFPPDDWQFDYTRFLTFYFGEDFFYPVVVEQGSSIIGVGNAMVQGKVGWLGNIIVDPAQRNQGIGLMISKHLIEYLKSEGCKTQVLIATEEGKPMYRKLGFLINSMYCFLKGDKVLKQTECSQMRRALPHDLRQVLRIDREVTGEERFRLIERFLSSGWVHTTSKETEIDGFYLPAFGGGLILATSDSAGLDLLQYKHSQSITPAILPCENKTAIEFLLQHRFREYLRAPRMILGEDVNWKPENIYSRAAGYCG
jgi:GNAT superfamily N-acetyltransferase